MRHILITGAAKGIGRATALHLHQQGYMVWAGVRNEADGHDLVAATSERLHPILLDVTNADHIAAAKATLAEAVGADGLFALINNAGIAISGPLETVPLHRMREQLEVNVIGQLAMIQAFLPLLRLGKGRIINVSSIAGRIATPITGPYHISKYGLEAMTDTLRQELAAQGIKAISIEPGETATPIWHTALDTGQAIYAESDAALYEQYRPLVTKSQRGAEHAAVHANPPIHVAYAIEKAMTAKRPRARYPVGTDAKLGAWIVQYLPARWRDWIIARV